MKTLEITTGFLNEEHTLKCALLLYLKEKQEQFDKLKKVWKKDKFVPNQHLYIADIKNCKSLLKKL